MRGLLRVARDRTGRNFSDASLNILLFNSKNTLILQGFKHYFTLHVIYHFLLGGYSMSTRVLKRSLKVSLRVFERACGDGHGGFRIPKGAGFPLKREVASARKREYGRGMGSTERVKDRDLVVGGRYLHRNGLFIRQIEAIEGDAVHYHDQESSWSCGKRSFIRACPTVPTADSSSVLAL